MSNYNPYTKRQTMIAPDYEVYRYRSTYMNEVELHHHDFYEIYLLLRGRVEYIVENQLYRVRPGDWMLCSPLELHQARIATDADAYERIVLWIARPYLEGLSTPRTSLTRCFDTTVPGHTNLLRLPGATGAPLRTTVDKLCALKADKAYGSDLLAQSALVELLVGLNRAAAERGDARPTGTSDQVVDAVLHYINEHYSEALTLDALADKYNIDVREKAFKGLIGKGMIEGNKVILVKPQTYMNLSGECIRQVMDYYKVDPSEFIVIYDDISLVPGGIRIRKKGSAGGHNGIKNIIAHLGTQEFPRVRIGVGEKPARMDLADYVLGHFPKEETETMTTAFKDGAAAVVDMMTEGVEAAMNHFNGAARGEKEKLEKQKAERKEEVKTQ